MPPKQRSVAGPSRGGKRYTHGPGRGHTTTTPSSNPVRDVYDPTAWTTTMDGTDEIDPDGDLTLLVGSGEHRFRVSRVAMRLASPVWKKMLTGVFAEATSDEVKLPADDPFAVRVVLLLAHLQYRRVPEIITLELLGSIAQIVDKYEMAEMANDRIVSWLERIDPTIKDSDYSFSYRKDPDNIVPNAFSLMWIGWAIKHELMFREGLDHVMWYATPQELAKDADLPPGCRDFLRRWCRTRLQDLLDDVYKPFKDEYDGFKCTRNSIVGGVIAGRCALLRRGVALDLLMRLGLPVTLDNKPDVMTLRKSASDFSMECSAVITLADPTIGEDRHYPCLASLYDLSDVLNDLRCEHYGEIAAEFSAFFEEATSKGPKMAGTREVPVEVD